MYLPPEAGRGWQESEKGGEGDEHDVEGELQLFTLLGRGEE